MRKLFLLLGLAVMNNSLWTVQTNWFANKHVLVTGGAGFIGSSIVDELVRAGTHVRVMDNLSNGNLDNLSGVREKIEFLKEDIRDFNACLRATQNIEIIFHCAAQISVPESVQDPKTCYDTNILGTYNLLEAARVHKTTRFVLSSSAAVYGPVDGECHEKLACVPSSPYGHSKLIGEQLCQSYAQLYGLGTICPRYFNVYGERQNPKSPYAGVRALFVAALREHKPITIFGDGQQTRDFVSVHEIVRANLALAQLPKEKLTGQPVNIASGRSITLKELLDTLEHELKTKTQVLYQPARAGDILHSRASIARYTQLCR